MQFGGAFDSPDPKARMLIINGQVWREGDEPVPGWVLERISLHAAQFRVQGRAVALPYDGGPPRRP
jgi:general secretion pathway protein B